MGSLEEVKDMLRTGKEGVQRFYQRTVAPNRKLIAIVSIVCIALMVVVSLVIGRALPGSALYGMKVNVFEPVGYALRISTESKAAYQTSLMEARLRELEGLGKQDGVTEDEQRAFEAAITKTADGFQNFITTKRENEISRQDALDVANRYTGFACATERVAERHDTLEPLEEHIEDICREGRNLVGDKAEAFVTLDDIEVVKKYLADRLTEFGNKLKDQNLREEVAREGEDYLYDFGLAASDNKVDRAITIILEGLRTLDLNQYFIEDRVPRTGGSATSSASTTLERSTSTATTTP